MLTLKVKKYGTKKLKELAKEKGQNPEETFIMRVPEWQGAWDNELLDSFKLLFPLRMKDPKEGSLWDGYGKPENYGEALYRKIIKHFADTMRQGYRIDPDKKVTDRDITAWIMAGNYDDQQLLDVQEAYKAENWAACRKAMTGEN